MACLEKDGSGKASVYEDEINLMDYILVLWKRKWFIFFATLIPTLVAGMVLFFGHQEYTISYTYTISLAEKEFKVFCDTFYSGENFKKLIEELQANNLDNYSKNISGITAVGDLGGCISFKVLPPYFKTIEPIKNKGIDELEKLEQVRTSFLVMQVTAKSKEQIWKIALVCRNNFEQILPLYSEKEKLNSTIISLKEEMADIEDGRYTLGLELERKKATLEKLRASSSGGSDKLLSDIVLQFNNVDGGSSFLPLVYQVQVAEAKIINLEEQIRANKEKYEYCDALLGLNEMLFSHVEKLVPTHYTLGQFCIFLSDKMAEYKDSQPQLQDYLKACIKRVENKAASIIPLVEKPKVYVVTKQTFKKSGIVFVIALMMSVFGAFLSDGIKRSQVKIL